MKSVLKAAPGLAFMLLALPYVLARALWRSMEDFFALTVSMGLVHDYTHLCRIEAERKQSFLDRLFRRKRREASILGMLGGLLAATYNYKGGVVAGVAAGHVATPNAFSVAVVELDFAAIATARTAAGQAAITTADVLEVITVRAQTWVPAVFLKPTTADGGTMTMDVGDGADPNGYIDDGDVNATTMLSSLITTAYSLATAGGKYYGAADTIDLIPNNATPDTGVVELIAVMVDLRSYRS